MQWVRSRGERLQGPVSTCLTVLSLSSLEKTKKQRHSAHPHFPNHHSLSSINSGAEHHRRRAQHSAGQSEPHSSTGDRLRGLGFVLEKSTGRSKGSRRTTEASCGAHLSTVIMCQPSLKQQRRSAVGKWWDVAGLCTGRPLATISTESGLMPGASDRSAPPP